MKKHIGFSWVGLECQSKEMSLFFIGLHYHNLFRYRYMEQCTSHECFSHMWNDILEGTHNFVHLSFGFASHMIDFNCTAADPIFYLLHNFVDNLFERARQNIKRHNPPLRWANISQLANNPNDPLLYFFSRECCSLARRHTTSAACVDASN